MGSVVPLDLVGDFAVTFLTSEHMSDRVKLAREIAARTEPRFIEIKPEPRRKVRIRATFIGIPRQRGGGRVPFTEAELTAMRGGLTAEEYREDD